VGAGGDAAGVLPPVFGGTSRVAVFRFAPRRPRRGVIPRGPQRPVEIVESVDVGVVTPQPLRNQIPTDFALRAGNRRTVYC
jgi:hypothetical protein